MREVRGFVFVISAKREFIVKTVDIPHHYNIITPGHIFNRSIVLQVFIIFFSNKKSNGIFKKYCLQPPATVLMVRVYSYTIYFVVVFFSSSYT